MTVSNVKSEYLARFECLTLKSSLTKDESIYRHNYRHNYFFTRAKYSDCGSFCFLRLYNGILFLESSVLQQKQAKMHVPAVWHRGTSYNRSFYDLNWPYEHRVIEMYEAVLRPRRCGLRDIFGTSPRSKHRTAVAITAFPDHLTTAEVHLLAGRSGDDPVRMLFLPEKGPPEVKYLRVTLNQILAKLDEVARAVEAKLESSPEEFEEQWERHSDLTSEDAWEGSNSCSEEGSDIESEDAADKDELEGHRSNIEETSGVESEVAAMSANET